MTNTKRSIIFIIPFLLTILLFSFILSKFGGLLNSGVTFFSFVSFLAIIVFPGLQAVSRRFLLKKYLIKDKYFFSLNMHDNKIFQRAFFFIIVFLIIIFPVIGKNFIFQNLNSKVILTFVVWIIISELVIQFSYMKTKVHFLSDGILIYGFDMRIDMPLSTSVKNHSGMYGYFEIDDFEVDKKNKLILHLSNNKGKIITNLPEDKSTQIIHFLNAKNIKNK